MQARRWRWVLVLAGCAATAVPVGLTAQTRQRDVLTRDEIQNSVHKDRDLLQIVRALRPHFLNAPRGARSIMNGGSAPVQLYVNDVRASGLDMLRQIKPDDVEEIRYLEPSRAQDQYGITHSGGAILVTLRNTRR